MTTPADPVAPNTPSRLRIAITSPDILARIRQVFASKNLEVEIVRMPYVEVAVRPSASGAGADGSAVGNALHRLAGPAEPAEGPAAHRLRAEYRLNVVGAAAQPAARRRPTDLVPVPDHGIGADTATADDPVFVLSHRQREVMTLVSRGVRNAEIAARLEVTEKTVKNHVNRIFRSLGAGSRVEAVLIWQRHQGGGAGGGADWRTAAPARERVTEY